MMIKLTSGPKSRLPDPLPFLPPTCWHNFETIINARRAVCLSCGEPTSKEKGGLRFPFSSLTNGLDAACKRFGGFEEGND
jgi:hypothetical protein